jgi:archaellum component FlaC
MFELIQPYFGEAFTALVVGLPTWFIARRKNNADATTTEIDNGSKVVDLYKSALDDLGKRYEDKYNHVEQMSKNISDLFDSKEKTLLQEIEYHKKQTALYKKMYDDKVREFTKYKKEHP